MKKDEIKDERIVLQRRRIQSDAYGVVMYCLLVSLIIQKFILNAPFSQIVVEFLCVVGMGVYMTIRYLSDGINVWGSDKQSSGKNLINSVVSGVICVALFAFLAGERNILTLVLFFLSFSTFNFLMHFTAQYVIKKVQKRMDDELNDDEANE